MTAKKGGERRLTAGTVFKGMEGVSYYRERADHLRRLAKMTWQDDLEAALRRVAQDYDEIAEDLEAGATKVRHPDLLGG